MDLHMKSIEVGMGGIVCHEIELMRTRGLVILQLVILVHWYMAVACLDSYIFILQENFMLSAETEPRVILILGCFNVKAPTNLLTHWSVTLVITNQCIATGVTPDHLLRWLANLF